MGTYGSGWRMCIDKKGAYIALIFISHPAQVQSDYSSDLKRKILPFQ